MLNTLKLLLNIDTEDNGRNELLSFVIDDCENLITSSCHTDEVPTKLESLIPIMAADMWRRKGQGAEAAPKEIKSISQGDRSVSYQSTALDTEAFLKEYEARLRPFRRGRVPSDVG